MVAVYPSIRDNPALDQLTEDYPEALKAFVAFGGEFDYTSGAGYLGSELYSFMIPLLLLVAAVGAGARAIAGEEERGTLELLLANPVSRSRIVLEKLAALVFELVVLGLVLWIALLVGVRLVDMEISAVNLGAATALAVALALLFGCVALLVGSASGHRGRAIGIASAGAVAAYFLTSLAPLVDALEPFQKLSPYYYYSSGDPLRAGSTSAIWPCCSSSPRSSLRPRPSRSTAATSPASERSRRGSARGVRTGRPPIRAGAR